MPETCPGEGAPVLKAGDKGSELEGAGGPGTGEQELDWSTSMPRGILGQHHPPYPEETQQRFQKWCFEIDL